MLQRNGNISRDCIFPSQDNLLFQIALDSRIDVGQGIKVEHGKFNKKKIWQKFEVFCNEKTGEIFFQIFYTKFNKRRAF